MKNYMKISEIEKGAEKFLKEISEASFRYQNFGEKIDLTSICKKYSRLFTSKTIEGIEKAVEKTQDKSEMRALKNLYNFAIYQYLDNKLSPLTDKIGNTALLLKITVDGEKIHYKDVGSRMMNEQNRNKRREMFLAYNQVIEKRLNPLYEEEIRLKGKIARELGYEDYPSLVEHLEEVKLVNLKEIAKEFQAKTRTIFKSLLEEVATDTLGLSLQEIREYDLGLLYRAKKFDKFFVGDRTAKIFKETVKELGLTLENIKIYDEVREKKTTRASCIAMSIPDDMRIVFKPIGGFWNYRSLFHEGGHALGGSNIKSKRFEFKYLGDNAVGETFAHLFENLLCNPRWLSEHINMPEKEMKIYLRQNLLLTLQEMRFNSAGLVLQDKLFRTIENIGEFYNKIMEDAQLVKVESGRAGALPWVEEGFYTIKYIQSWFFEPQLRTLLSEKFGEEWYKKRSCGKFLKELWKDGGRKNLTELADELELKGIQVDYLIKDLERRFQEVS